MGTPYDRRRFVVPMLRPTIEHAVDHAISVYTDNDRRRLPAMKILCVICREPATYLAPIDRPRPKRWPYCSDHGPGRGTPLPRVPEGAMAVLKLVWETEECTKIHAADRVAGNRNRAYGYRMVDRAIEADLITAEKEGRRYILRTTRLGRAILLQVEETV